MRNIYANNVYNRLINFFSVVLMLFVGEFSYAQTVVTITSGSGNWTVPCGVYSIDVECWGAGGGGGGGDLGTVPGGSGGGGGAYAKTSGIVVTPGALIPYVVGAGGPGQKGTGTSGGDTKWNTTTIIAKGGTGGTNGSTAVPGTGGTDVASTGAVKYSGGNGGLLGAAGRGGGGGGSAGPSSDGNAATNAVGGAAVTDGGAGGNGATTGNTGLAGSSPGGAGGGGGKRSGGATTGGDGADGQIRITYTVTPPTSTAAITGNWSTAATWGGTLPLACNNIIIPNGKTVTITAATSCNNITIETGGALIANAALTVGGTFTIESGGTYTHANTTAAATTIFAGTEAFDANSNIIVNSWSGGTVPFASAISGDLGNLTLNYGNTWNQDGEFSNHTIQGNLSVTAGSINFDGINASTGITIGGSASFTSTGSHSFYSGSSVPATYLFDIGGDFTVGNNSNMYMFSQAGTHGQTCTITLDVNGNLNAFGDFYVTIGCIAFAGVNCTGYIEYDVVCNISGDMNIAMVNGTDNFDVVYLAVGDCDVDMNVTGDINCTAMAGGWYHYVDLSQTTGDVTIDCTNMLTAAGTDNDFRKGPGLITINCTGTFTHSGATTTTHLCDGTAGTGQVTLNAADIVINDGTLYGHNTGSGNVSVSSGTITMNLGTFNGTRLGNGDVSFVTTGDVNMVDGSMMMVYNGDGDVIFNVGGTLDMDGGDLRGIYEDQGSAANGLIDFDFNAIDYDGGLFIGSYGDNPTTGLNTFTVTNDVNLNFTGSGISESVRFGVGQNNGTPSGLDLDIGGDLIVSGDLGGIMISHLGNGNEDIDIVGSVNISGAENSFNGYYGGDLTCDHNVTLDIGGDLTISNGTTSFSREGGTLLAGAGNMIDGNVTISGGTSDFKHNIGAATVIVGGNYSQTGGTLFLHDTTGVAGVGTSDVVAVTITGTFSQTGGILNFDDIAASTATHTVTLNGSAITVGGTGSITREDAGTGTVFGEIYVNPSSGSTTYNRTSTTHQIDQARIIINAGKTMDASGSAQDIQIAANDAADDAIPATTIMLDVNGVLNAGTKVIHGRSESATQRPTSVIIQSGAELQTANANGMYDGTTSATLAHLTRNSANTDNANNSMNWWLDANSTVTYNGSANQVVTGKYPQDFVSSTNLDATLGSTAGYHYAFLDINHQGTIGTNYVYPTASNVFVRSIMDLIRGEFRLDGSGTGFTINMESGATSAITVTGAAGDAYIRSETNLGTNPSIVRWYLGATTGAHVIPFGHSAGASNYIPFTFNVTSGTAGGYLDISTRATDDGTVANNKDNLPWESTVTNMYSPNLGQDGATESVIDRWWQIDVSAAYAADITFSYRGVENTLDAPHNSGMIGAQRWDGAEWQPDNATYGSAPAVLAGVGTCTVSGVTQFSPWILSSLNVPLPAVLVSFEATCKNDYTVLNWVTSSEQNNREFVLSASNDGENYIIVDRIEAAGNSASETSYVYKDETNSNYYKLEQVDNNGATTLLDVIESEKCGLGSNGGVLVYPNPSEGPINIAFREGKHSNVDIVIFDSRGRVVWGMNSEMIQEDEVIEVPSGILENGVYLVTIKTSSSVLNRKIILK